MSRPESKVPDKVVLEYEDNMVWVVKSAETGEELGRFKRRWQAFNWCEEKGMHVSEEWIKPYEI